MLFRPVNVAIARGHLIPSQ